MRNVLLSFGLLVAVATSSFASGTGQAESVRADGAPLAIPNFSEGYTGEAPDMGAHQRGTPPMRYGVEANQR